MRPLNIMPSFTNPFDTQTVHFLDGPFKGAMPVKATAVKEGNIWPIPGGNRYQVQCNSANFRWEAVTIGDETASTEE
jgi:hypothetical protein